jgi:hypothetical protein
MKIKGLTLDQIKSAAIEAGYFKLDNVRVIGNYTFFVLRMAGPTPGRKDTRKGHEGDERRAHGLTPEEYALQMRFRKRGYSNMAWGRGPEYGVAVCFHGFRAFMRACFARNPNAIIRTCRAAYLGSEDFEAKWPAVGSQNVGSQMCPIAYSEACDC